MLQNLLKHLLKSLVWAAPRHLCRLAHTKCRQNKAIAWHMLKKLILRMANMLDL